MVKTNKKYWFRKFLYAFKGMISSVKEEKSMVVHLLVTIIVICISLGLNINISQWIVIVIIISIVIAVELLNTAIENLVDLVSFEFNINAQKIKDTSAAATLVTVVGAIIVAFLVFIPRILEIANGNY